MKSLELALRLLTPAERKTAMLIMPLIILSGFSDMVGVAMIFPFLKVLGEPEIIQANSYLSAFYAFGGFTSTDEFIVFLGIAFCGMLMATAGLKILTVYVANRWLEGRVHSLSKRLLTAYLQQPYPFMLQRNSSELVANMLSETARIVSQVFRAFSEFVVSAVTLVFMVVLLLVINPSVTLLAMGTFSALYAVLLLSVRRISNHLGLRILSSNRQRHRLAMEALIGGKQVRLLNRERTLVERYARPSSDYAHATALSNTVRMAPRHIIEALAIGATVLMTLILTARSGGTGSAAMANILPTLGVFVLALYRMMPAFQRGYNASVSLRLSSASARAILEDVRSAAALPPLPQKVTPLRFEKSIEFRQVSFRYPGAEEDSLKDVTFTITAGMSVGIVGRTGAGKTTLMDLILGLLEPSSGEIRIDGRKLSPGEIRAWRANVGYVQQDIYLSDATVAQNIAFGVPEAEIDTQKLRAAARMAQIEDFILRELPDGYETFVGERGVRLSGGQRQRLSIARALYPEPEVIVFDEATSALDSTTEAQVMAEISKLAGAQTLIMVAHRHTTVRDCDIILTLENGALTAITDYDSLFGAGAHITVAAGG
jgi:ABC-type multidrug transport system fused ATPase/permease subunit